jgi:S1-C subfamily serine protease
MKGLKAALLPILAGAIAGAVVALILSGGNGNGTTQTVTEQVTSGTPTSFTKSGGGLTVNQIYKKDVSGVVDIEVTAESKSSGGGLFGGGSGPSKSEDEGSGVVYNNQGYILTDEHVIANATSVTVNFNDGYSAPAKVIGSDAGTDLGVIKVNVPQSQLHPLAFANSDTAQVGDPVVAIGSPFGQRWTTTAGIVSAVGRVIQAPNMFSISDSIQTDAAINPGNSGGPLLNSDGAVIGLNDQIETDDENSEGEGQSSGVGFATPANSDVKVAKAIIAGKPVQRAYVGVTLVNAVHGGAQFHQVFPGGPAAKAGIKAGDVVTAVNGQPIATSDDFITVVGKYAPGNVVTLTLTQGGKTKKVKVTLGNQPKIAPGTGTTTTGTP